ncbi:hypothetical protein ACFVAJ_09150 [Agromyces sp. NPDC057679]|uniref:hypothetical protein n=1 Tax=Agromyces sp. NPDC057679 TaxID=3346207 RepID=UPI00366C7109
MVDALGVPGLIMGGAIALFAVALVVGMVVRAVRAPSGHRMREAFGPLAGAGETYQELHTGQRGLQDSIIESVQEQEHGRRSTNDRKHTR